jgi:hypothetical protein
VVREYARKAGIEKLAPHDLQRTCARLCHAAGGELEQIQFLLGHVSIQTTERYLGCKQRIRSRGERPHWHRARELNQSTTKAGVPVVTGLRRSIIVSAASPVIKDMLECSKSRAC